MTLGADIALDRATHDLVFKDGDLIMVADLRQAVKVALQWFLGEWFLDPAAGMPWLQQVFTKPANVDFVRAAVIDCIAGVDGILEVTSVTVDFDAANRNLRITWSAIGEAGPLTGLDAVLVPL